MGKHCQLVMGPAGVGKSTYCSTMITHCETIHRRVHLVNLDPAAENFPYKPSIDIRDLITLADVQEELGYGPNGGLIYCLEFLCQNMDFLQDELGGQHDDDYLIIDCPGQIELYTHFPIMRNIVELLQSMDYRVCGVYLLDSQFVEDTSKFFAGIMTAMSAMVQLEIPHINVMSKMDLIDGKKKKKDLERYLYPDPSLLLEDVNASTRPKFHHLNEALVHLIEEYNMVTLIPLNIQDEESIELVLSHVDNAIQYGEDLEPKEPKDEDFEEWEERDDGY
ncbi:GPN-loop GTPase [Gaertneriomyces semiglobifer]|nr:GPN-loop GTPase [Gaertneriomyces semiglobifer]